MVNYKQLAEDADLTDRERSIGMNNNIPTSFGHSSKFSSFNNHNFKEILPIVVLMIQPCIFGLFWVAVYLVGITLAVSLATFVSLFVWIIFLMAIRVIVIATNGFFGIIDRQKVADYLASNVKFWD